MTRAAAMMVGLACLVGSATGQDQPKGDKVEFTQYNGHFEKNNSGLAGAHSFLLLPSREAFDKVFGTVPPLMGNDKAVRLPANAFDKGVVAAVVTRADAPTEYSDVTATLKGTTLTVAYKSKTGPAGTAKFASPLILSLPKDKFKDVVFVNNGKEVGTAK